jgi:hypothetical protein
VTYRQPAKPKPEPKSLSHLRGAVVFCTCNALVVGGIFTYLRAWASVFVIGVSFVFQLLILRMAWKQTRKE